MWQTLSQIRKYGRRLVAVKLGTLLLGLEERFKRNQHEKCNKKPLGYSTDELRDSDVSTLWRMHHTARFRPFQQPTLEKEVRTGRHQYFTFMSVNPSLRNEVIGAWELVSYVAYSEQPPSQILYPLGKDAKGMILYTSDGYMSAQLQCPGQKDFAATFPADGSESELAESARRFVGYSGRFDIDDSGPVPVLVHNFFVSSFPNWVGDKQRRVAKLDGDQLTLSLESPIQMKGEQWRPELVWRRPANN